MNQKKENFDTLASAMRALIRAAGGSGQAVAIAADFAERVATLWFDGNTKQILSNMPWYLSEVRKLRWQPKPSAPEQPRIHLADEPEPSEGAANLSEGAADQPKAAYHLEAQCKGEVHAACHQDAVAAFVASIAQFITAIYIRSAQ